MSRTFKDKRTIYGGPGKSRLNSTEMNLSRRFENFKRFGPLEPKTYHCHYCGRLTEFEGGYLVCHDCGEVEMAFGDLILDPVAA
jgi:hypothetical protein